ncbi:MAG TPA: hypothetical protein VFK24_04235 [Gammaproteobacteria bacterium]|nr:hypothetical protein [Gammaproteobacteria bacterium]
MTRMIHILPVAALAAATFLFAACSTRTTVPSNLGINDAPGWVNQGSQALDNQGGRLIHGIGSAPAMHDLSLQTSAADERARTEVARVLSSFIDAVSQDYAAAAGTNAEQQQNEASVSREIENVTRQNVAGARIIAHWRNPDNGALWSLAELDMTRIKAMVASSQEMNSGFKQYFLSHADNLFDNMTGGAK